MPPPPPLLLRATNVNYALAQSSRIWWGQCVSLALVKSTSNQIRPNTLQKLPLIASQIAIKSKTVLLNHFVCETSCQCVSMRLFVYSLQDFIRIKLMFQSAHFYQSGFKWISFLRVCMCVVQCTIFNQFRLEFDQIEEKAVKRSNKSYLSSVGSCRTITVTIITNQGTAAKPWKPSIWNNVHNNRWSNTDLHASKWTTLSIFVHCLWSFILVGLFVCLTTREIGTPYRTPTQCVCLLLPVVVVVYVSKFDRYHRAQRTWFIRHA